MVKFYLKWFFIHCGLRFVKLEYAAISACYLCIFPIVCLFLNMKMEQYITCRKLRLPIFATSYLKSCCS